MSNKPHIMFSRSEKTYRGAKDNGQRGGQWQHADKTEQDLGIRVYNYSGNTPDTTDLMYCINK